MTLVKGQTLRLPLLERHRLLITLILLQLSIQADNIQCLLRRLLLQPANLIVLMQYLRLITVNLALQLIHDTLVLDNFFQVMFPLSPVVLFQLVFVGSAGESLGVGGEVVVSC
jgi:hypothetical protein